MRSNLLVVLLLCSLYAASAHSSPFSLAPLIGNNMVLQQRSSVPIWGTGIPGTTIAIEASWGRSASGVVGPDGSWRVAVRTAPAGGPYELSIRHGDTTRVLRNVMLGEVWLCSGQSNMEMPLEGWPPDTILHATYEIAHATNPAIRLFSVRRSASPEPERSCTGQWEEATPATARSFSAAAYFFGRELQKSLRVPIGLINASFGGTPVEAWTSAEFLSRTTWYDSTLGKIQRAIADNHRLKDWLTQFPTIDVREKTLSTRWQGLNFKDSICSSPSFVDSSWPIMHLPTVWERTPLGEFDGVVWFRKSVTIPASWVNKNLSLSLGPIDDMDITYVNGRKVGSHETGGQWKVDRIYTVPAAVADSTVLHLAIRVVDNGGGGGIFGDSTQMVLSPVGGTGGLALSGEWRYQPVADYRDDHFYVFGSSGEALRSRPPMAIEITGYTPTALFNGMIAPLVPYALAGVIWYQGEANTGDPLRYRALFPLMIDNWRHAFEKKNLPFYFVQLAPYDYGSTINSAFLREAQFRTLSVDHAGMVVTLDIGNRTNIHPANKQEVGRRLSLWALARTYGRRYEYTGPIYRSFRKFRDRIELNFDHAGKSLVLTGGEMGNGFEIAGEDSVFKPAEVTVRGARIIVSNPEILNPQAVRYAFGNTVEGTLFNAEGLPASSFRTDDWEP